MTTSKKAPAKKKAPTKKAPVKKAAKKAAPKKKAAKKAPTGCFFTTACTQHFGLADNCMQLTTLRAFRDEVLSKSEEGRDLIQRYYQMAPSIVEAIDHSLNPALTYTYIFDQVNATCSHIEAGNSVEAIEQYSKMVRQLETTFEK